MAHARAQALARAIGAGLILVQDPDLPAQSSPDLIVLDAPHLRARTLPALRALTAARPATPVCILTAAPPAPIAQDYIRQGARGIVLHSQSDRVIALAFQLLLAGEGFLPLSVCTPQPAHLTARERDVLHAIAAGKGNKTIAHDLGVSEPTVKLHVRTLLRRLGARNRIDALGIARAQGLLGGASGPDAA